MKKKSLETNQAETNPVGKEIKVPCAGCPISRAPFAREVGILTERRKVQPKETRSARTHLSTTQ